MFAAEALAPAVRFFEVASEMDMASSLVVKNESLVWWCQAQSKASVLIVTCSVLSAMIMSQTLIHAGFSGS